MVAVVEEPTARGGKLKKILVKYRCIKNITKDLFDNLVMYIYRRHERHKRKET